MARPCDLLRHAWFEVPGDWNPPFDLTPMTLRCERCGSERRDGIDRMGNLGYRVYVRTEGWVTYARDERPSINDLRLDWIKAHVAEARKARRNGKVAS
jgi:hypothetical protein